VFRRFSTLWWPTCRPAGSAAIKGIDPKTEEEMVRKSSDDEPLSLLAFKIMDDPYGVADLLPHLFRQGLNQGFNASELLAWQDRAHRPHGADALQQPRRNPKHSYAGDIVALVGLKEARTGDTLCDVPSR
jgi:elongation factor G